MIDLATSGFDAPWDAILYEALYTGADYAEAHSQFVSVLADAAHGVGLDFIICQRAIVDGHSNGWLGLEHIASADEYIGYAYALYSEQRLAPYWWATASVQQAIAAGRNGQTFYLGLPNYSTYWPVTGEISRYDISHDQAQGLAGSTEWIESNSDGLVRERYASVGDGHIWLHDGDTISPRLDLVDEYGLAGIMLYCPGMGDESVWQAIAEWKRPRPAIVQRQQRSAVYGEGGLFGDARY